MSNDEIEGVSLAEYEYAWKYWDSLELGDEEPDETGFDPERIRRIKWTLDTIWKDYLDRIRNPDKKTPKHPTRRTE